MSGRVTLRSRVVALLEQSPEGLTFRCLLDGLAGDRRGYVPRPGRLMLLLMRLDFAGVVHREWGMKASVFSLSLDGIPPTVVERAAEAMAIAEVRRNGHGRGDAPA